MKNPFSELVAKHGFEQRYTHHLEALVDSGIDFRHVYSHPDENSYLMVDLDNRQLLARITLWESGDCEIDIVSFKDSSVMSEESYKLTSADEYEEKLLGLIQHMKDTLNPH